MLFIQKQLLYGFPFLSFTNEKKVFLCTRNPLIQRGFLIVVLLTFQRFCSSLLLCFFFDLPLPSPKATLFNVTRDTNSRLWAGPFLAKFDTQYCHYHHAESTLVIDSYNPSHEKSTFINFRVYNFF